MFTKLINSVATTNGQTLARKGVGLWSLDAFNAGGAAAFVKLYDKLDPVIGTDVPAMTIAVPTLGNARLGPFPKSIQFRNALSVAITNLGTDADATAVAANQIKVALVFG